MIGTADRALRLAIFDWLTEQRDRILEESDGPMLIVGLQQIHGQLIDLPASPSQLPDRDRLSRRYEEFLRVS